MTHEEKSGWKKRLTDELWKLSIAVTYFWIFLTVFTLYREIVLANYTINYTAKLGFALINALILAKFMWLGEVLHAGKKAAGKALLYSTLWNSALFAGILMICHFLEEALLKLWHGQPAAQSFSEIMKDPRDRIAMAVVVFVVLIPFFLSKGLIELLGKHEARNLLFRRRPKDDMQPATN